jgi:DNA-binding beta-propeller fold protein YncE
MERNMLRYTFVLFIFIYPFTALSVIQPQEISFIDQGRWLAVTAPDERCVLIIDPAKGKIDRKIELSGCVKGLAAWENTLYMPEYETQTVQYGFDNLEALPVPVPPTGLAVAPRKKMLVVSSPGLNKVAIMDLMKKVPPTVLCTGNQPNAIAISADESIAVVANQLPALSALDTQTAASVTLLNLNAKKITKTILLPYGSTNARQIAISPDGKWAYVVHTRGRVNMPTTQLERGWVNTNALSIIDLEAKSLYASVLLDNVQRGAADPWGIELSPDGKTLWTSLSGVHEIAKLDLHLLHGLLDGSVIPTEIRKNDAKARVAWDVWEEIREDPAKRTELQHDLAALYAAGILSRYPVPVNGPRGLALSPDNKTLAVSGYYSANVVLLDANTLHPIQTLSLNDPDAASMADKGEALFHDAAKGFQGWLSCATCHPEGRSDGLNWDLLNDGIGNPKNTKSLVWSHETPPAMSRGVRASYDVAVNAGFKFILFAQADKEETEAVKAYIQALRHDKSPWLIAAEKDFLKRIKKGEKIFKSKKTGCATCHTGPLLTDQKMYNVGTRHDLDYHDQFDNPTLMELWRTGPYLHDGSAADLLEMLTVLNKDDRHGVTSHLDENELQDLVAYLLSL